METSTEIPAPAASTTSSRFTLRRSRTDRMLSGVCGGVAEALKIDVNLVRLGLVALTVLGAGSGALLYVAAWVLIPEGE
jgi:phage shock protein C